MPRRLAAALLTLLGGLAVSPATLADEFERLDGRTIRRLTGEATATESIPRLGFAEIAALPTRLADSRSALVLARSGQGHLVRLLLGAELRRPVPPSDAPLMVPAPGGPGMSKKADAPDPRLEPVPVVVVERLDTFDSSDPAQRLATRREVTLFDGLPIDLDTGQVVPPDPRFGADLVLRTEGGQPPRLEPIGGAKLFLLRQPLPTNQAGAAPRPTPGRTVVPADCAGRFHLVANGQWSGVLDLRVGAKGVVTGTFRSDLHGSTYPVTGQVAPDAPGRLRFAVALPRARQEFEGYLFGEGKGAMAGTVSLLERTYGFFAVREGGRVAPEGAPELGVMAGPDADRPGRIVLERSAEGSTRLDGQAIPPEGLRDALKARAETAPPDAPAWVLIRAGGAARLADLEPLAQAAREAGLSVVRFEVAPAAAPVAP